MRKVRGGLSRSGLGGRLAVAALAWLVAAPPAEAQHDLAPEAVALIEQSIAAHGGGPARLRVTYRGPSIQPDQGAYPDGPVSPHPMTIDIAVDEQAGSLAYRYDNGIDGGFTFPRRIGFAAGRGFASGFTGEYDRISAMPADANAFLPHRLLRGILNDAASIWLTRDGALDKISYRLASGAAATLVLDRSTHLLRAVLRPPTPSVFGDQTRDTFYGPYRRVGTVLVPETVVVRLDLPAIGPGGSALSLVAASADGPTPAELAPPAGAAERRPSSTDFETVQLGRDVYLLRNAGLALPFFSYNVLLVVFEDHVLAVEAALDDATARRVIETAARIAPGKPIRTLVQTHHHGDHIGGIRTYIAQGTTVVAPLGMGGFVERIASHSRTAPPRIEEVETERIIRDRGNEVRLYVFPSAHAAPMLIVYLPEQRVMYQGDLISAGELPLNPTSTAFLAWLRERRLPVEHLTGLHGRTVSGAELRRLVADERLDASPAP